MEDTFEECLVRSGFVLDRDGVYRNPTKPSCGVSKECAKMIDVRAIPVVKSALLRALADPLHEGPIAILRLPDGTFVSGAEGVGYVHG